MLEPIYSRQAPLYDINQNELQCAINQIVALPQEKGVYAIATDEGICLVKTDQNDIIHTLNKVWFFGKPV